MPSRGAGAGCMGACCLWCKAGGREHSFGGAGRRLASAAGLIVYTNSNDQQHTSCQSLGYATSAAVCVERCECTKAAAVLSVAPGGW